MRHKFTKKQLYRFFALLSFPPYPWQKRAIWQFYRNGLNEFHLVAPRQNGKSQILLVIALIELLLNDNKVTYTSHRVKSCTDFFNKIKQELNFNKSLRKQVLRTSNAVGSQFVQLKSGAKIEFYSRSKDAGIGDSNDVIIFDEFQILNEKQMSAIFPTLSAKKNSVTIYAGTSPRVIDDDHFYRLQREKHFGTPAWCEFGLGKKYTFAELKKENLFLDKKLLKETNPSFNIMIPYNNVEREFGKMDLLDFCIQRLGLLHDEEHKIVFSDNMIKKVLISKEEAQYYKGEFVIGIKFGADNHCAVIGTQKNGGNYLQVLDKRSNKGGFDWLADYIIENDNVRGVMADGLYTKIFVPMLKGKFSTKGNFDTISGHDFIASQNVFEQEVTRASLKISTQESIRSELANVTWREVKEYHKFAPIEENTDVVVAEAMAITNYFIKTKGWD